MLFHQVDGSAQSDAAPENGFRLAARRVPARVPAESEGELEVYRKPAIFRPGELPEPAMQVGANLFDLAVPYAGNGRREILRILRRDAVERAVGSVADRAQPLAIHG